MSYDQIGDKIGKIRLQFNQRKGYYQDAKSNISELETLVSSLEKDKIKYDKKEYAKALSALDSGDYKTAVALASSIKNSSKELISVINAITNNREILDKKITDAFLYEKITFPKRGMEEVDVLISKNKFPEAENKIQELHQEIDSIISNKRNAATLASKVESEITEAGEFIDVNSYQSRFDKIRQLITEEDFGSAFSGASTLRSDLVEALDEKPEIKFEFPQNLVAQEWNKSHLEIN